MKYSVLDFLQPHIKFDKARGSVLITSISKTLRYVCLLGVRKVLSLLRKTATSTEILVLGPNLRKGLEL